MDGGMDRKIDGAMDGGIDIGMKGWMDRVMGKMDRGIDREIDKRYGLEGWTGWSEGWIDKRMEVWIRGGVRDGLEKLIGWMDERDGS
jgi:hypothetical protein